MALNIQRALEGQQPAPFLLPSYFRNGSNSRHVLVFGAARWVRRDHAVRRGGARSSCSSAAPRRRSSTSWRRPVRRRALARYGERRVAVHRARVARARRRLRAGIAHDILEQRRRVRRVVCQLAAPWLLKTVAVNWIILLAAGCVGAVLSDRLTRMYSAVLFALGLLLWGQGNLWNADYGVLAGRRSISRRTPGAHRMSSAAGPRCCSSRSCSLDLSAGLRRLPRSCFSPFKSLRWA